MALVISEAFAAWSDGYDNGLGGFSSSMNPYHPSDPLCVQWVEGFLDGREDAGMDEEDYD